MGEINAEPGGRHQWSAADFAHCGTVRVIRAAPFGTIQAYAYSDAAKSGHGVLPPVPAPKIHLPAPPGRLIDRGRLSALLDVDDTPVVLVCAPAGDGKTTLLSTWAVRVSRRGHPVAWVQLDADDNDPFRLWSTILRAVRTVAHSPELDHLSPPSGPIGHGFPAALANAID